MTHHYVFSNIFKTWMKILPKSATDRCGLLNNLYHKPNHDQLYYIPENAYNSQWDGFIQKVINCENYSDWASKQGQAYFIIKLYTLYIKPSNISLTRRYTHNYPTSVVLEGLKASQWKEICPASFSFTGNREVSVKPCKSNDFFQQFRLRQTGNSDGLTYLEFDSFDIFGRLRINKETIDPCIKQSAMIKIFIIMSLMIIVS